ncbi:MAG: 5'-3' exonuclease H3TH domain-containing protein, partial [Solirubrobacterales bacterium]
MAKRKEKPDDELFLIDGNSLAYRAFFALPESIATADGRPTNAIYGFASMMAKLLIDHSPRAVIVAWDKGWSGRENVYPEYKSQRKSRPDLLKEQWPHLAPLAEAFGFRNVAVEGYEADDVIATLTRHAVEAGLPVMIVSGDRDVYQLVREGVRVMITSRGITETRVYDHDGVIERYGVPPDLVTAFIGLKGDTSDNIPGVPGIGDKTAAELLQRFGSLEAVLGSVDEISGAKRKQNLIEHADDARVSQQLATMVEDVDVPLDATEELRATPDRSKLRDVANQFELRAVIQRLDDEWDEVVPGRAVEETIEVEAVEGTPGDLADPIALAVSNGRWAGSDGEQVVAGPAPTMAELAAQLKARPLVAHDVKGLGGGGRSGLLAVAGPGVLDLAHDTMVAAYLIDPARRTYDLHELAADAGLAAAPAGGGDGQLSLAAEEG